MNDFHVVIPARYASTRLPGKPLLDIAGMPMVVRVAERAKQAGAREIIIATDHQDIFNVVEAHGFKAMMTESNYVSGTDRIAEVVGKLGLNDSEVIVNVQGDEPLIDPNLIVATARTLSESPIAVMSTACHLMPNEADWNNPNIVKVVLNKLNHALYFSRASIPFIRDVNEQMLRLKQQVVYRHIGIYAYRAHYLKTYANMQVADIEHIESLEQLRVLYDGHQIAVTIASSFPAPGVDSQEDLVHVRKIFLSQSHQ